MMAISTDNLEQQDNQISHAVKYDEDALTQIADFERALISDSEKQKKPKAKRGYHTKRRIESLHEKRYLKALLGDDYYDEDFEDWE